jgi:hypothetical protein
VGVSVLDNEVHIFHHAAIHKLCILLTEAGLCCWYFTKHADMTSVWLTPEIAHFAVFKYFSRSSTYLSYPEQSCSPMLCCTPSRSAALPCALPHSAARLRAAFPCFAPCRLASPVHLIPLSFLVTTYTLVPGPLGHLVYKPCNYTLLPKKRNPVASPLMFQISQSSE